jgi:LmbE family N-acetylglucosaminyl deacetylase
LAETKVDVLFTAPHPDDLEIGMGGAIAKLVRQGYKVGMLHMTTGEPTPRGSLECRARESAAAAEVLGVAYCQTLELTNRELMDGPEARYAVATVIRQVRPRILVGMAGRTPAASPDHYQGQLLTEAARFYSQLTKWDDRFDDSDPFRVDHLVYRPVPFAAETHQYPSRFVIDISDTLDVKLEAISCYRSQFDGPRLERVLHIARSMAGAEGALAGFAAGELYAMPRVLGTSDMVQIVGDWQIPPPFGGTTSQHPA